MLIDTDVLVWLFRGRESARQAIEDCGNIELSAVTYMELVQGVRDKSELNLIRRTIADNQWRVIPIGEDICHRAMLYVENHVLKYGTRLADALIAATAIERGTVLLTANVRHYRFMPGSALQQFKP